MADLVDIALGTSFDLNENSIPDECEEPVPTVSVWGLMVMSLVLMMAGTILFRRRCRHTAA